MDYRPAPPNMLICLNYLRKKVHNVGASPHTFLWDQLWVTGLGYGAGSSATTTYLFFFLLTKVKHEPSVGHKLPKQDWVPKSTINFHTKLI